MKNKNQILIIHGGMTFRNDKDYLHYLKNRKVSMGKKEHWAREYLEKELGRYFEITIPKMPLRENAKYRDWKIHFEKYASLLRNNSIIIGSSLGGVFLAKYLSENKFPRKILSVFLICAPFDDTLPKEDLVGGFRLGSDLSLLEKNTKNLCLLFSKDDDIVPVSHAGKYRKKLKDAKILIYKSKNGHFNVSKFPEIVKMIKNDVKKI